MGRLRFPPALLAAVAAFSRIPVQRLPGALRPAPDDARVAAHAPAAGLLVGLAGAFVFALLGLLLHGATYGSLAAATGSVLATTWLLGLSMEAGLVVIFKLGLLSVLAGVSPGGALLAVAGGHAISRGAQLWLAQDDAVRACLGPATPLRHLLDRRQRWTAAAWCALAPVAGLLFGLWSLLLWALLGCGAAVWLLRRRWQREQNALTPARLEEARRLAELGFYLGAAIGA